jgi:hypothetical protein
MIWDFELCTFGCGSPWQQASKPITTPHELPASPACECGVNIRMRTSVPSVQALVVLTSSYSCIYVNIYVRANDDDTVVSRSVPMYS